MLQIVLIGFILISHFASFGLGEQILVETCTGKTLYLEVEPGASIAQVKEIIQNTAGIPVAEQKLTFNGVVLSDSLTLTDYNIVKEDLLCLVPLDPLQEGNSVWHPRSRKS